MEKICTKCKVLQPLENFCFRKKTKDGRSWHCKNCRNKWFKEFYSKNKERHIKNVGIRNIRVREESQLIINKMKEQYGCLFCSESTPICLDFHHINPEDKKYEVSTLVSAGNMIKVYEEISKCILICSNCHRKLHAGLLMLPNNIEKLKWDA